MAKSGFKWDVEPGLAFPQLVARYTNAIMVSGRRVAQSRAEEAEQWMKDTAPWQDRTGDARRGLHVEVREAPAVLAELVFSHGDDVPYGIWLEVSLGGKNAIIAPAVDYWGARLMQDVQRIVNLGLAAR
jgi:hypothetical protein